MIIHEFIGPNTWYRTNPSVTEKKGKKKRKEEGRISHEYQNSVQMPLPTIIGKNKLVPIVV